jgi:hypothetical protein
VERIAYFSDKLLVSVAAIVKQRRIRPNETADSRESAFRSGDRQRDSARSDRSVLSHLWRAEFGTLGKGTLKHWAKGLSLSWRDLLRQTMSLHSIAELDARDPKPNGIVAARRSALKGKPDLHQLTAQANFTLEAPERYRTVARSQKAAGKAQEIVDATM